MKSRAAGGAALLAVPSACELSAALVQAAPARSAPAHLLRMRLRPPQARGAEQDVAAVEHATLLGLVSMSC
jgi:hypothetical protein